MSPNEETINCREVSPLLLKKGCSSSEQFSFGYPYISIILSCPPMRTSSVTHRFWWALWLPHTGSRSCYSDSLLGYGQTRSGGVSLLSFRVLSWFSLAVLDWLYLRTRGFCSFSEQSPALRLLCGLSSLSSTPAISVMIKQRAL